MREQTQCTYRTREKKKKRERQRNLDLKKIIYYRRILD